MHDDALSGSPATRLAMRLTDLPRIDAAAHDQLGSNDTAHGRRGMHDDRSRGWIDGQKRHVESEPEPAPGSTCTGMTEAKLWRFLSKYNVFDECSLSQDRYQQILRQLEQHDRISDAAEKVLLRQLIDAKGLEDFERVRGS